MSYKSEIIVDNDIDKLFQCLIPEKTGVKTDRGTLDIIKLDGHLKIQITAKDAVALRATLNSVVKLLIVYEKMRNLKNGKQ